MAVDQNPSPAGTDTTAIMAMLEEILAEVKSGQSRVLHETTDFRQILNTQPMSVDEKRIKDNLKISFRRCYVYKKSKFVTSLTEDAKTKIPKWMLVSDDQASKTTETAYKKQVLDFPNVIVDAEKCGFEVSYEFETKTLEITKKTVILNSVTSL